MKDMRCDLDDDFIAIIREYQAREGITIAELARRMRVSRPYVSRMLSDDFDGSTTFKTAKVFLNRLGIRAKVEYDFGEVPEKISA